MSSIKTTQSHPSTSSTSTSPAHSTALGTTSNSPACAVCKYRRRRCAPDCILAPYFPADHQKEFLNVHKLFGVSNMIRVLESIEDPSLKENAMKTMIYQANVRATDPARGCCRIIDNLERQLCYYKTQLESVYSLLEDYRTRELHGDMNHRDQMSDLDLQAKTYVDMGFNGVTNCLDDNEFRMMESWRESDSTHFVHGLEVNHDVAGKKPLVEHHIRDNHVGEYHEPSSVTAHIKSKNELAAAASILRPKKLK